MLFSVMHGRWTGKVRAADMAFIEDILDCELIPQVYVLEGPDTPWRPILRDDPFESAPHEEDPFDIL